MIQNPTFSRRRFMQHAGATLALPIFLSHGPTIVANPSSGPTSFAVLTQALRSSNYIIQADAARLLGDLKRPAAIAPLVEYVSQDRRPAKTAGIDALARLGDPSVAPTLAALIDDPNVPDDAYWYGSASVRVAAAVALLQLGDERRADYLLTDSPTDGNKKWAMSVWFSASIASLPDTTKAAVELKNRMRKSAILPPTRIDPGQIVPVCDTLAIMNSPANRKRLVELLQNASRYVRAQAARALLRNPSTPDEIATVQSLADHDPASFARLTASIALTKTGSRDDFKRVLESTQATDPLDRAAAIDGLRELKRADALEAILARLTDADEYVRICACEAIAELGDARAVDAVRQMKEASERVALARAYCLLRHEA